MRSHFGIVAVHLSLVLAVAGSALPSAARAAEPDGARPATVAGYGHAATPPPAQPVALRVRLWAYHIGQVDLHEGTCAFDGALELSWPPGTGPREGDPRPFEIMNAVDARIEDYGGIVVSGRFVQVYRVHASLRVDVDLERYPFDTQTLELQLEHPLWTIDQLSYAAESQVDPTLDLRRDRVGADVRLRDWQIEAVRDGVSEMVYAADQHFGRYTFTVEVRRSLLPFLVGELAPIVLMVLIGLAATFLPAKALDAKLLLTVLALLVAVELQAAGADHMPHAGYLLLSDWLYVLSYLSIGLAVVHAIAEHRFFLVDRFAAAKRVRWGGFVLAAAVFFIPLTVMMVARA
ncbi:MAG: hypothetical protein CVU56_26780 [Deltaproteobacteria bacterium HGW-Deltaproteobacteria-14]|jgi:hypothetical protein|nr:MAG: hypothetical protein CVU56_26780 [Deltaproteobacteria bacterium HGW-Deltaproteobacteria-14]